MSVLADLSAYRKAIFGQKVDRATAVLPATTQAAIFTVTGGRVIITAIVGEVTTIIQAQPTTLKIRTNPTVGADSDLCATVDMNAKEVGTLIGITGLATDAALAANAGYTVLPRNPVVVPVGTLDLVTGATSTGSVKWSITYIPLDDGASVVAA